MERSKRIGVIGSLVWDVIYGRDPHGLAVEEWGGIGYALSGLDAALPDDWEIVPLIKVGHDLSARATQFVSQLKHLAPDAALIEVPVPNNRVELRYFDDERRSESMSGGVPAWTWLGLKPVIDAARLDALYVNFLSFCANIFADRSTATCTCSCGPCSRVGFAHYARCRTSPSGADASICCR